MSIRLRYNHRLPVRTPPTTAFAILVSSRCTGTPGVLRPCIDMLRTEVAQYPEEKEAETRGKHTHTRIRYLVTGRIAADPIV